MMDPYIILNKIKNSSGDMDVIIWAFICTNNNLCHIIHQEITKNTHTHTDIDMNLESSTLNALVY